MRANFAFDFVIAVKDHDANVEKYHALLGIEPIELNPEQMPSPGQRCTIFPLWRFEDRGMVLSLVSSSDPDSDINLGIAKRGEGLMLFGLDVDDVDAAMGQARDAGVKTLGDDPISYVVGRMIHLDPASTNNVPMFFSQHTPGWWAKCMAGLN